VDLDFHHEERENGGSTWPSSHVIHGVHPETGERVGFLKYRTPRRAKDKIQIDRLEVEPQHKGNGYGGQMMDHLQERHPRTPIDHGDRTDEGQAWWNSYTRGKSVSRGRTLGSRLDFRAAARPLYHGTSRDLTSVEPADRHGQGEMSTGLTRTDRAYATHDPQMARSYAEMSGIDTGRRPRVYQVEHSGPAHDLEPDPGYDADVRTPHSFRVLREVPEHELTRMPRRGAQEGPHCPCGMPVAYDVSNGWQHADGSISHDDEFYGKSVSDLMEERDGRTAGKGKPRHHAPDVARGADQAGPGSARDVAPNSGRGGDGGGSPAPLRALAEHPKVSRDLAKLPKNVRAAYHERVDGLRRGEPHSSTHALTGPLKGWQATSLNFQNRMVHRYDGDELHVLSAGNHDESYDMGIRRSSQNLDSAKLAVTDLWPPHLKEREDKEGDTYPVNESRHNPRGPVGTEEDAKAAGWAGPYFHGTSKHRARQIRNGGFRQPRMHNWEMGTAGGAEEVDNGNTHRTFFADSHSDALEFARAHHGDNADVVTAYLHPDHIETNSGGGFMPSTQVRDVAKAMAIRPSKGRSHEGRYTAPHARLFGPTYGLDTRLWDGEQLKLAVRASIVRQFTEFCERHGYRDWPHWARIVFFGSEASEWTAPDRHGNNDFDLSIGIQYFSYRLHNHADLYTSDVDIAARFTEEMHAELNDPQHTFPGVEGVYDQTWFANLQGWDIAEMRPYAAYEVVTDQWLVRPPHLPDWSLADFPEGPGMAEEVKGIVEAAEGILAMPEPYRTQNGAAFWEFVHANRSDAFGPQGEGWWDPRNVIEKALDQKGLMQKLFECHRRAAEDPGSLSAPADWSNSPTPAR
jgi:GNAT superfamily N-acetyltransferase/mRNA-degrading endonuclease YafQ of YafQ-DinJ toxin-antitoxin module